MAARAISLQFQEGTNLARHFVAVKFLYRVHYIVHATVFPPAQRPSTRR
jgi:hypothetical protein